MRSPEARGMAGGQGGGALSRAFSPEVAGMGRRAVRAGALLVAVAVLAACGKKPDFPLAPSGPVPSRTYPNPVLDPQPAPRPPDAGRRTGAATDAKDGGARVDAPGARAGGGNP